MCFKFCVLGINLFNLLFRKISQSKSLKYDEIYLPQKNVFSWTVKFGNFKSHVSKWLKILVTNSESEETNITSKVFIKFFSEICNRSMILII